MSDLKKILRQLPLPPSPLEPYEEYQHRIVDQKMYIIQNVYIDLRGVLHPLPFAGGLGLWQFDGQFYYKLPLDINRPYGLRKEKV